MGRLKYPALLILVAGALGLGYFVFSMRLPPTLEFQDRQFPKGFRNLVLKRPTSRFDPTVAFPQKPFDDAAPTQDALELCNELFRDPHSPTAGRPDYQIQLVTFLDYRCPYCRTLTNIMSNMQPNVRITYKEWPILGDSSVLAARAALAAHQQGKYLEFHTRLMNTRLVPTTSYIEEIASELGMNLTQLRDDMGSDATTLEIKRTSTLASALGFIGTPALVVGRTIVEGEITRVQLGLVIEGEMRQQSPRTC